MPDAVLLAHLVWAGIRWPDDQTDRRFVECTVQDVDHNDLVLEVVVVDVVVLLVVVSVRTKQDEL